MPANTIEGVVMGIVSKSPTPLTASQIRSAIPESSRPSRTYVNKALLTLVGEGEVERYVQSSQTSTAGRPPYVYSRSAAS